MLTTNPRWNLWNGQCEQKAMIIMMLTVTMITNALIQCKSKIEVFEMVSVNKKPHSIHPTKLLFRHKDNMHLKNGNIESRSHCSWFFLSLKMRPCNFCPLAFVISGKKLKMQNKPFSGASSLPPSVSSQPQGVEPESKVCSRLSENSWQRFGILLTAC